MSANALEGDGRKVLITGAGGRTGSLVFKKLQAKPGIKKERDFAAPLKKKNAHIIKKGIELRNRKD